jgi:hypothetical protein
MHSGERATEIAVITHKANWFLERVAINETLTIVLTFTVPEQLEGKKSLAVATLAHGQLPKNALRI